MQIVAYEGGKLYDNVNESGPLGTLVTKAMTAANRDPRIYDQTRRYLDIWNEICPDSLLCYYNSCQAPGVAGAWGAQEYEGQPLEQAHKLRAVLDYLEGK